MDSRKLFPRVESFNTSGHSYKVRGGMFNRDVWGQFFLHRELGGTGGL